MNSTSMIQTNTTVLLLALLFLTAGLSMAETASIKFSHVSGAESPTGKATEYFKRLVEQRSNQRIHVEIDHNGTANSDAPLEALKSNAIQMAAPDISVFYPVSPQLRLFELPFLFKDSEHLHRVIDGEIGATLLESVAQGGLVALSFWDNGFRQLTTNRLLSRPQQLEGLRFPILKSEVLTAQLKALGAQLEDISSSQLFSALADKRIDGQENTLARIYSQKLHQVQSNLTITDHSVRGFLVATNERFWTQLPDELKVIIKGAIKDAAEYTRDMARQANDDALKKIEATALMQIHRLTREEKELWAETFEEISPESYKRISGNLVQKAREEK